MKDKAQETTSEIERTQETTSVTQGPNLVTKAQHGGPHGVLSQKRRSRAKFDAWQQAWGHKSISLRQWAIQNNISYMCAYKAYRRDRLPVFAYQRDNGVIVVNPYMVILQQPLTAITLPDSKGLVIKPLRKHLLSQVKAQLS